MLYLTKRLHTIWSTLRSLCCRKAQPVFTEHLNTKRTECFLVNPNLIINPIYKVAETNFYYGTARTPQLKRKNLLLWLMSSLGHELPRNDLCDWLMTGDRSVLGSRHALYSLPLGLVIDKILTIPIPFSILLIDPIPYRFSLSKEKKGVQTGLLT